MCTTHPRWAKGQKYHAVCRSDPLRPTFSKRNVGMTMPDRHLQNENVGLMGSDRHLQNAMSVRPCQTAELIFSASPSSMGGPSLQNENVRLTPSDRHCEMQTSVWHAWIGNAKCKRRSTICAGNAKCRCRFGMPEPAMQDANVGLQYADRQCEMQVSVWHARTDIRFFKMWVGMCTLSARRRGRRRRGTGRSLHSL